MIHESIIETLVKKYNLERYKFRKNMLNAVFNSVCSSNYEEKYFLKLKDRVKRRFGKNWKKIFENHFEDFRLIALNRRIVPDAYCIDEEKQEITCFEVVNTCEVSDLKLNTYIHLWFYLDYIYWDLIIYRYDKHGNKTTLNLSTIYLNESRKQSNI